MDAERHPHRVTGRPPMPYAPGRRVWTGSSVKERIDQLRQRADSIVRWAEGTIIFRIWERLLENEFLDRSVALGAKAFVSFFPALIVIAAFVPSSVRSAMLSTVTRRIGVSGPGEDTIRAAFASSDDTRRATGIIGLLFTFFYINSFTASLRRVYTRAWRRPTGGVVSRYSVGAIWLASIVAYLAMLGAVHKILSGG